MRVIGVLVAVAAMSASVRADGIDNTKEADALFLQGRTALGANHFEEACKLFFDAQEKQRENPAILINLGLCNEKQDKLASALRWYRKTQLLTQGKTDATNKEYEDTARERVNALQSQVSKVTFALGTVQPNAELLIDGETISRQELIVEVDRGPHVLEVRAPGMVTSREPLNVEDNSKQLSFTFKALAPVPKVKFFTTRRKVGLGIAGGVIVVTSGVSAVLANNIQNKNLAGDFDKDTASKKMLVPSFLFGGGIAVGVAIVAIAFLKTPGKERTQTAVLPTAASDSLGVAMFRRF